MKKGNKRDIYRKIKYVVINKSDNKATLFRYKTQIAEHLVVSTRTLDRKMPYETADFIVSLVNEIHI